VSEQQLYRVPTISGLAETISSALAEIEGTKVFFVGRGSYAKPLIEDLQSQGITVEVFRGYASNPLYEDVVNGVEAFKAFQPDLLVSVGGGSALDTAKCIQLFATVDALADSEETYLDAKYSEAVVPHFVVPTTAGTGSDATTFAVVYYKGDKYSVDSPQALPNYVALVPEFLHGLSIYQKRATMLDALCQAIESYWSVNSTDESKAYSVKAINLILANYRTYLSSTDDDAAEALLEAAYIAGQAINITKTTAPHAMSYKMSGLYDLAHGHACAIALPKVWRYMLENLELCSDPRGVEYLDQAFGEIASYLGADNPSQAIAWLEKLLAELDMRSPKDTSPEDLEALVRSINVQRLANNPVALDSEAIELLYQWIIPSLTQDKGE